MGKVTQVNNGDTGLQARTNYNEAMKTAETDGVTITGDGTVGNPLVGTPGGVGSYSELSDTPAAKVAKKLQKIGDTGTNLEDTPYDYDQIVELSSIDVSDISEGESKILIVTKVGGDPTFGGAISQIDKLGPPALDTLLAETAAWVGDEITLTGDNQTGQLGENSQEYRIGSDFFLCISHSFGTGPSDGTANWVRNRGQDSLTPGLTNDDAIIAELVNASGWSGADFKQIVTKSKQGTWYRAAAGGFLYMCIDKLNGWSRVGVPNTVDLEITSTSHPILTASLTAHTWTGYYTEGTNPSDEPAEQGQKWRDTATYAVYERFNSGFWAKIV
jgi:hypothetical protein